METKGWGPCRYNWFSICSIHRERQEDCRICNTGHWMNNWKWKISGFIFSFFPKIWKWWMNLDFVRNRAMNFENRQNKK